VTGCCTNGDVCRNDEAPFNCPEPLTFVSGGVCGEQCRLSTPTSTPTVTETTTATATTTQTATPSNTPTITVTATQSSTPTVTATHTKVPDGGGCRDPVDCVSGNCVNNVCCTDPVCPPGQSCNNPGNVGQCSPDPATRAPAISPRGVVLAVALLIAIGAVALVRWRRSTS
jgi:hypothetical protein